MCMASLFMDNIFLDSENNLDSFLDFYHSNYMYENKVSVAKQTYIKVLLF